MMDAGKFAQCAVVFLIVFLSGVYILRREGEGMRGGVGEPSVPSAPARVPPVPDAGEPFSADFPDQTKILLDSPASKGWRQTGEFPVDYDEARELVDGLMRRRGYGEKQTVSNPEFEGRCLSQWESPGGKKILWTLWRIHEDRTGFSWGESK